MLHSSMNFRVNANKPNYILWRMPKIVYTEYDIDDEKEESKNHESVKSQKMQLPKTWECGYGKRAERRVNFSFS